MKLKDLISDIDILHTEGDLEVEITHLTLDSRTAGLGSMFFAVRGAKIDGHNFIDEVITHGGVAVVCEDIPENTYEGVTYIKVSKVNDVVGLMASAFFGHPSLNLNIVGVTGTNGKTTIATMLFDLFEKLGEEVGLISTVENKIGSNIIPTSHTTPNALLLQEYFHKMVEAGCKYVFMEVSSHAVDQGRINGTNFKGGVFTNLTQDHLDYHKTMEHYAEAKKSFFSRLSPEAFAITNIDDPRGLWMTNDSKAVIKTYGEGQGDFAFALVDSSSLGMKIRINDSLLSSVLVGKFNAYNLTAIFASAVLLGKPIENILGVLGNLTGARGRMEKIIGPTGKIGIVDYSHTPDALKNALETINGFKSNHKIITVFGAGGDRDKTKRPIMGEIAESLSDFVIITSDNPRSEDPEKIIEDIMSGIFDNKTRVKIALDRDEAIKTAVDMAKSGDIIFVAGKGHEDYQDVNGVKTHFSDKEVLRKYL